MSGAELTRRGLLAGGLALAATAGSTRTYTARSQVRLTVGTPAGPYVGAIVDRGSGERAIRFRGIRYGLDTRPRRFQAPLPAPDHRAPYDASGDYAPSCPQQGDRYAPTSEDCLFLNIWTPNVEPRTTDRRPVMVYFHGGAYSSGSVADPLVDGAALADRGGVVVVTVNHRLNAFGYLYLARLDPRFPDSGNAGQLDLILALRWIRRNIIGFGGDPDRIMVFGQSGGGAKIATMMGMPAAANLFHRAATMSGQQVTASGPLNATARTRAFLQRLGNPSIDALVALPAERIVEGLAAPDPIIAGNVYLGPVLDMKWLDRHPFWPDAHPQSLGIPMILGNTRQETGAFIAPDSATMRGLSWDNLAERMAPQLRVDISPEWIVAQYRARFPDWTPQQVMWDATTAGRSWPGQVIEAEARARAGAPTWVYQCDFASRTEPARGALHTIDIPLAFGTLGAPESQTGTGADAQAASRALQDAFVRFAATGDPNSSGTQIWPRYDLATRATMIIDTQSRVENDPRGWQRELFARAPYVQPGT